MSADNYIWVRLRPDGKFGVSMRFASISYEDDRFDSGDDWDEFAPVPDDRYGVFDKAVDAILTAHRAHAGEAVVEYGVLLGPGVEEDAR